MADECVGGQPVADGTTGDREPPASTGAEETGQGRTSGGPGVEEPWEGSTSTGASDASSTSGAESSGGSEESSTGAERYGCAAFEFDAGPVPFEALSVSMSVDVVDGLMLASWPPSGAGAALYEVAHGVDLSAGVLEVSFADIAGASEGTTASLRWTDASDRIIAAVLDGGSYAVSYYDPMLPEEEQTSLTVYPVLGREVVRLGAEGGSIVVKAGQGETFETLRSVDGNFDLTQVDVGLFFDRYTVTAEAASLGLESLSLCAE